MKSEAEIREAAALLSIALLQGISEENRARPNNQEVVLNAIHMLSVLLWVLGENYPEQRSVPDFGKLIAILKPNMADGLGALGLGIKEPVN